MHMHWGDLDLIDELLLPADCHLDLHTGHLVEHPGERTVAFRRSPYPVEYDHVRELRQRRLLVQRATDPDVRRRLLRVLDDFASDEHREAVRAYLATITRPARRAEMSELIERFYRQPEEREATLGVEPHWARDTAEMSYVRLRISRREIGKLAPELDPYADRRGLSDFWDWFQRLPVPIDNEPHWLPDVLRWRETERIELATHVSDLLARWEVALGKQLPDTKLAPGVTDVSALEAHVGLPLPDAVKQLYAWHESSDDDVMPIAYGYSLLSPADVIATRRDYAEHDLGWSAAWIPLLRDPSGNYVVLDLEGRATGLPGQVLAVWHDDPEASVIAYDLASWLETLVTMFEGGKTLPDDAGYGVGYIEWAASYRLLFACDPTYFPLRDTTRST